MRLRMEEKKLPKCIVCKKKCSCTCLEIDADEMGCIWFCSMKCYDKSNKELSWDMDFGSYKGHYYFCEEGGMFKEKWKEAVKEANMYNELYSEFHKKWKEVKYEKSKDQEEFINKCLERLKGYACGGHKQLEKQMLNRIKNIQREVK